MAAVCTLTFFGINVQDSITLCTSIAQRADFLVRLLGNI